MTQNNLGMAYSQLPTGDRGENLRRAVACYDLALVHLSAGDRRAAREFAARAVGHDPDDEKARALLDQLRPGR